MEPELAVTNTANQILTKAQHCQRVACNRLLPVGTQVFYVADLHSGRGRYVCGDCHIHYGNKRTSVRRPTAAPGSSASRIEAAVNLYEIRRNTNGAQRGDIDRAIVAPMPRQGAPSSNYGYGPRVGVPSYRTTRVEPLSSAVQHAPALPLYSSQHAKYHSIKHDKARDVYAKSVEHQELTFNVKAFLMHETGKPKLGSVNGVMEGIENIDAKITAVKLKTIVFDKLFSAWGDGVKSGYIFILPNTILRGKSSSVNLENKSRSVFWDACHKTKGDGAVVPVYNKTFQLDLVIKLDIWESYLEAEYAPKADVTMRDAGQKTEEISQDDGSEEERQIDSGGQGSIQPLVAEFTSVSGRDGASTAHGSERISAMRPPPPKFSVGRNSDAKDHLSRADIIDALRQQGKPFKPEKGAQYDHISFIHIPDQDFAYILHHPTLDVTSTTQPGILVWTPRSNLAQRGGFKTVHAGKLTLNPVATEGLGQIAQQEVVVKRIYQAVQGKVQRLAFDPEYNLTRREGEALSWAKALWRCFMEFIAVKINEGIELPDPDEFPIFQIRWVDAALVDVIAADTDKRMTLLLEERINGKFHRFIHNTDPRPMGILGTKEYQVAEFLAFSQHVQWEETEQIAYLSDYQGDCETLTDPQVMTHPELGMNLFGEGNVPDAFKKFPTEHRCNNYCLAFNLVNPTPYNDDVTSLFDTSESSTKPTGVQFPKRQGLRSSVVDGDAIANGDATENAE